MINCLRNCIPILSCKIMMYHCGKFKVYVFLQANHFLFHQIRTPCWTTHFSLRAQLVDLESGIVDRRFPSSCPLVAPVPTFSYRFARDYQLNINNKWERSSWLSSNLGGSALLMARNFSPQCSGNNVCNLSGLPAKTKKNSRPALIRGGIHPQVPGFSLVHVCNWILRSSCARQDWLITSHQRSQTTGWNKRLQWLWGFDVRVRQRIS